jgi:hypothetical protein
MLDFLLFAESTWARHTNLTNHTTWSVDCDAGTQMVIEDDNQGVLEIASNQVYIRFAAERVDDLTYILKYIRPKDLGRGGLTLDWSSVSQQEPMATLRMDAPNKIKLTWIGFATSRQSDAKKLPTPTLHQPGGADLELCPSGR